MLLIKNGFVVDPANKIKKQMDVLVDNGKIVEVSEEILIDDFLQVLEKLLVLDELMNHLVLEILA